MGIRAWGPLLGAVMVAGLSVASLSLTEPPCAYLVKHVGVHLVALPAIITLGPPGEASGTCSSEGVSTPAVRIHLSRSLHDTPGAVVEVPSLELHLADGPVTRSGHLLHLESGNLLFVPRPGGP